MLLLLLCIDTHTQGDNIQKKTKRKSAAGSFIFGVVWVKKKGINTHTKLRVECESIASHTHAKEKWKQKQKKGGAKPGSKMQCAK